MNRFPGSPNAYPMRFGSMARISIDSVSDNDLAKLYEELENKEAWMETCKNCRMPALLHVDICKKRNETWEYDKILDERDKFSERMKPILRYAMEQKYKEIEEND